MGSNYSSPWMVSEVRRTFKALWDLLTFPTPLLRRGHQRARAPFCLRLAFGLAFCFLVVAPIVLLSDAIEVPADPCPSRLERILFAQTPFLRRLESLATGLAGLCWRHPDTLGEFIPASPFRLIRPRPGWPGRGPSSSGLPGTSPASTLGLRSRIRAASRFI